MAFSAGPKYIQIAEQLRKKILADRASGTGYLAQERELAKEYSVSRNTLRNALDLLQTEGLIVKVRGQGIMLKNAFRETAQEYVVISHGIHRFSNSIFVCSALFELAEAVRCRKAEVVFMTLESETEEEFSQLKARLTERHKKIGIVLLGRYTRKMLFQLREYLPWPAVLFGDVFGEENRAKDAVISQIVGSDYAKMYSALEYLLKKDCRRIAVVGFSTQEIWGNAYHQACVDAYREAGLVFDESCFLPDCMDLLNLSVDGVVIPADLAQEVRMLQTLQPGRFPRTLQIVGLMTGTEPQPFPCVTMDTKEMVAEVLQLLELEQQKKCHLYQRRIINNKWLLPQAAETNGLYSSLE